MLAVDRKSTRLNSSHSPHDALPISRKPVLRWRPYWAALRRVPGLVIPEPAKKELQRRSDACRRSEEHTSELQSLPARRSSDLKEARPPLETLLGCPQASAGIGDSRARKEGIAKAKRCLP